MSEIKGIIGAIIYVSDEPVRRERLLSLFADRDGIEVETAIEELKREYEEHDRGLLLREVGGGLQITTRPECDSYIREYFQVRRKAQLSPQALETLAIIAYEQPISTPEVRELRGADPGGVLRTLLERKLVRIAGRKEVVGRPFLWVTTNHFLVHFGLASLDDLPKPEEFVDLLESTREPMADQEVPNPGQESVEA